MKDFSTITFQKELTASKTPVLVDFWAAWCGPCRMLSPIVEQIATAYESRLLVGKVNVDEEAELAMQFGIQSIPTLLLFKDGKPVDKIIGAVPPAAIKEMVEKHL